MGFPIRFCLLPMLFQQWEKWNQKIKPLENLVWTNICKIRCLRRNPSGEIFRAQRSLALETLRLEIDLYRPSLIYFASGCFASEIVDEAVGTTGDTPSSEERKEKHLIWWRESTGAMPGIVWSRHPQGKSRELKRAG